MAQPQAFLRRVVTMFLLVVALVGGPADRFWQAPIPRAEAATIRYVAPGGNDGLDCTNSAQPCATPQRAADQALASDEIRIAAGQYVGISIVSGHLQVLNIAKSLTVRGGYTVTNWTTSDPITNRTIFNARGLGRVIYIAGGTTAVIENLEATNGLDVQRGGGIY